MQLQPEWTFEEALSNINDEYPPYGYVKPQLRNSNLEAWEHVAGRTRALATFDEAVANHGSLAALGRAYHITTTTLRRIRHAFDSLPDDEYAKERRMIARLQALRQETETVDAKRELVLREMGDKAEFVKDIVAMANNGEPSYLIIGLDDRTFTPIGRLTNHHTTNDINQLLADKIDPPIVIDYRELFFDENEIAIIEINGQNRPYMVARDIIHERADRKRSRVHKGTIYVRHADRTEGISRAELEAIFRNRRQ